MTITAALTAAGYPFVELPDGFVVNGEANPVLESLLAHGAKVGGVVTDPAWLEVGKAYHESAKGGRKRGRDASRLLTLQMAYEKNFELLARLCDNGAAIFCGTVSSAVFMRAAYEQWAHIILAAWEKGAGRIALPFAYKPEFVLFCHHAHKYSVSDLERCPAPVFRIPRVPADERIHPAEKPVALLEVLVRMTTPKGELVIDPFAGSFSTMRAARNVGRRFLCVEASREFYERGVELARKEGTRKGLL